MADGMVAPNEQPLVEFVKLISDGRDPKRADRSAAGYLPSRAMRYCDALAAATGYGYWLFPVADLQFLWDGEQIFWSHGDAAAWLPLSNTLTGAVQYPGFEALFDEAAPEPLLGYAPPFLTVATEPGTIQLWTGLLARTRPGWSLSVRTPVNLPPTPGISLWEGVIETDDWFGPLFTVFRITKTDFPVRLRAQVPFLQIQPVPQLSYRDEALSSFSVRSMDEMTGKDWDDFREVVNPLDPEQRELPGSYAVKVRKRRACPHHTSIVGKATESI